MSNISSQDLQQFISLKLHLNISPEIKNTASRIVGNYDIKDSDEYGIIFSKLDRNGNIDLLDENQLITEQGSSLVYISNNEPTYIISLIADYINDKYSLNITLNKETANE